MRHAGRLVCLILACLLSLSGCSGVAQYRYEQPLHIIDDAWRTWYEVFVPSFSDADGDGTGDLAGLTSRLDYLNDGNGGGLGVGGIWLMPIMPSPSYHKYDVTNYEQVDPAYGTLADLQQLARACHSRGMRLIIDYELNHTSSQHPWFVSATASLMGNPARLPANPYVGYYNFVRGKPSVGSYAQVGTTEWYYEDQFGSSMPDLNLDNRALRAQIQQFTRFWLAQGVDGFRLDAVLSYYGVEIGMTGSRTDPDKRGSMQWSASQTAGRTTGPPGMGTVTILFPPEDVQEGSPASLLNYYRRAIRLRNENPELARGSDTLVTGTPDPEVAAVIRTWQGSRIVLVTNTAGEARTLDLAATSAPAGLALRGYLSATGAAVSLSGTQLQLPPLSIALLK